MHPHEISTNNNNRVSALWKRKENRMRFITSFGNRCQAIIYDQKLIIKTIIKQCLF